MRLTAAARRVPKPSKSTNHNPQEQPTEELPPSIYGDAAPCAAANKCTLDVHDVSNITESKVASICMKKSTFWLFLYKS